MTHRRAFLAAVLVLGGCGFELRKAPELRFRAIQFAGFKPRSPLADELKLQIESTGSTRVVPAATQAQVVLEVLDDVREKVVVASSAVGQVTEFQLRSRFRFRVRTPGGRELIEPTELLLTRDMSYTESAALGKEQEESFLFRTMQGDIVSQVLRRLASIQDY